MSILFHAEINEGDILCVCIGWLFFFLITRYREGILEKQTKAKNSTMNMESMVTSPL